MHDDGSLYTPKRPDAYQCAILIKYLFEKKTKKIPMWENSDEFHISSKKLQFVENENYWENSYKKLKCDVREESS